MDHERIELEVRLNKLKASIIDYLSSPEFAFPLERQGSVSNGTTTYVYKE